MTNKEYKARVNMIDIYSSYDYLGKDEISELRKTNAEKQAEGYTFLSGCNYKAMVKRERYGTVLTSYKTEVCMIDNSGKFVKLWDGYSATTMKHINRFREIHGLAGINKRKWVELKPYIG